MVVAVVFINVMWLRKLSAGVLPPLLIYIALALYIFWRADSMIFLPQPATYQDTENILKLSVTDTEKISAIHLPNPQAKYTLLYIHGNAEDLGGIRPVLDRLHSWGFSVFAYDYRGYGTSDGIPTEHNAYQDAATAYQYLTQTLNVPPATIIAYGRSVGGGSATELANRYPLAGVILEGTFTSAFRVVVPIPLLPFDKFPNLKRIKNIQSPVLVMHGQADRIVPVWHGQKLYEVAPTPKMSLWVPQAGHNDFTWVAGERHRQALLTFQELVEAHSEQR